MAATLVTGFTRPGDIVYDPFSGCGTVALEAWLGGRAVYANDLSPYAYVLTQAKLFPPRSSDIAFRNISMAGKLATDLAPTINTSDAPRWVRHFFHPKTLREIIAWKETLLDRRDYFSLACLLGILHHQRPGFLSFPSSHAIPYLRRRNFPQDKFPHLYEYRPVQPRLEAKIARAFRRVPSFDRRVNRRCYQADAARLCLPQSVQAIITSPPYMSQLDYARDNRLRLWILGVGNIDELDTRISPSRERFLTMMRNCFLLWKNFLKSGGNCVLVIANSKLSAHGKFLPEAIVDIAQLVGGYVIDQQINSHIPDIRRVRRGCRGSVQETILVLRRVR